MKKGGFEQGKVTMNEQNISRLSNCNREMITYGPNLPVGIGDDRDFVAGVCK